MCLLNGEKILVKIFFAAPRYARFMEKCQKLSKITWNYNLSNIPLSYPCFDGRFEFPDPKLVKIPNFSLIALLVQLLYPLRDLPKIQNGGYLGNLGENGQILNGRNLGTIRS